MRSLMFFACLTLTTPLLSFAESSAAFYVSLFYNSKVKSSFDYKNQEYSRNGLSGVLGFEVLSEDGFLSGGGLFTGGGALGSDIGEFIVLGADIRKLLWLVEERIAIPVSLDFAWRMQFAYIENMLVAAFIDEPRFLWESESYLSDKRVMKRHNFDIMPAIDLQFFLGSSFSFYAGYMYRLTLSSGWEFEYRVPDKKDEGNTKIDRFKVPEEFNPMKNSKEQIFGIPGALRFGIKFY